LLFPPPLPPPGAVGLRLPTLGLDERTDIRSAEQTYGGDGLPSACSTERVRGGDHQASPALPLTVPVPALISCFTIASCTVTITE